AIRPLRHPARYHDLRALARRRVGWTRVSRPARVHRRAARPATRSDPLGPHPRPDGGRPRMAAPSLPDPAVVLSVSALTQRIRSTLEGEFGSVWVSGEISTISRPSSGHVYISLKDEKACLQAVVYRGVGFRLRFEFREGMQVIARGRISMYEQKGQCQLVL